MAARVLLSDRYPSGMSYAVGKRWTVQRWARQPWTLKRWLVAAAAVAVTLGIATPGLADPIGSTSSGAASAPIVFIDERVGEAPNAVAVADDGIVAASLHDARAIALVTGPFSVVNVPIGCSPSDVAIAPDARYAWAVCQGDPHLYVVDIATREFAVSGLELTDGDDVAYLPGVDRLVIADLAGQIVVTTADPSYEEIHRVRTTYRPTELAPLPDGSGTYAITDFGELIFVDFARKKVTELTGQGPGVHFTSLAISPTGTHLYAAGYVGPPGDAVTWAVMRIDPVTGRVLQTVELASDQRTGTIMSLAAGRRSLSLAIGLPITVDGQPTGALNIAVNAQGVMGATTSMLPILVYGTSVSRSSTGTRAAVGTTNDRVVGAYLDDDQPWPPSLTIKGSLKKSIVLTGTTTGLARGASITVHVKDLTRKRSPFVTQPVTASVDAHGNYRWQGKAPSRRVQVFATAPAAASVTISLPMKK
jgi:hypothetical protein